MGLVTNAGRTLWATALQIDGGNAGKTAVDWVDFAPGCGTLSAAVTAGTPLTSLPLDATLPVTLAGGASLVVTDGTHSEAVTVVGGGATAGASSIGIVSWTPANSYVAHVTAVTPAQAVTDVALYNGSAGSVVRVAANPGVAGAAAGESLESAYFDGTQATAVYAQVGYFGGSAASSTPGTGTLIAEDIQVWNHTKNADAAQPQLDVTTN